MGKLNPNSQRYMKYLPEYYQKIKEVKSIAGVIDALIGFEGLTALYLLDQMSIGRATTLLYMYEEQFGLPQNPYGLTYEQRRELIRAKLRTAQTCTLDALKNVAESFKHGTITIQEDNGNYALVVTFAGESGIPSNLQGFKNAIRAMVPAHIGITYTVTNMIWDEFDAYNKTWDQWDTLNLTWDSFEKYREVTTS